MSIQIPFFSSLYFRQVNDGILFPPSFTTYSGLFFRNEHFFLSFLLCFVLTFPRFFSSLSLSIVRFLHWMNSLNFSLVSVNNSIESKPAVSLFRKSCTPSNQIKQIHSSHWMLINVERWAIILLSILIQNEISRRWPQPESIIGRVCKTLSILMLFCSRFFLLLFCLRFVWECLTCHCHCYGSD